MLQFRQIFQLLGVAMNVVVLLVQVNIVTLFKISIFFKIHTFFRVGRPNSSKHPRRTENDIMFEIMTHGPVQGNLR